VDRLPLLEEEDLDKAEDWFRRHGEASVLLGRCIPVVRSLISVPAGVEGMPRWRFLLLTTLGSGVWNSFFVLAGYALGSRFEQVGQYSSYLNYAIYAAIVVLLALGLRRAVRRHRTA
jgi:membrane protein DedA with SNARE-associated domain